MNSSTSIQRSTTRLRSKSGLTLVEVLVASVLLAMVGTSLVALFVQNYRMSKIQSFRTQAISTSLSVLEQMRFMQYPEINIIYQAGSTGLFSVQIADPKETSGYKSLSLPVNVRDDTLISSTWTPIDVALSDTTDAQRLPMRFFVTLKRNQESGSTPLDVFEVIVLYQWLTAGKSSSEWQTGNARLVIPRLNPLS